MLDEITVKTRQSAWLSIAPEHRSTYTIESRCFGTGRPSSLLRPGSIGDWRVVFSSRETIDRERRGLHDGQRAAFVAPLQSLLSNVFSVLFPSDCRLCGTPLNNISRVPVCAECLSDIGPVREPQCMICGDRLLSAQLLMGDGCCQGCRDFAPEFARAVSYGEYDAGLRDLIHLLKYEAVLPVAPVLGTMLASSIAELLPAWGDESPIMVPVPLHKSKLGERGFNQAEAIARAALKHLPGKLELATAVLVRQRATVSQVGLTRELRIQNMRDAFRVTAPHLLRGRNVVLVDDVMTTGTTLSECARVLKKAGAEKVWAATVARTLQSAALRQAAYQGDEEEVEAEVLTASV